jgi:hypothetical protein
MHYPVKPAIYRVDFRVVRFTKMILQQVRVTLNFEGIGQVAEVSNKDYAFKMGSIYSPDSGANASHRN